MNCIRKLTNCVHHLHDLWISRQARRMRPDTPGSMWYPMPASIEFQLDCMIHTTQIEEAQHARP
jgi:hypothetical protein